MLRLSGIVTLGALPLPSLVEPLADETPRPGRRAPGDPGPYLPRNAAAPTSAQGATIIMGRVPWSRRGTISIHDFELSAENRVRTIRSGRSDGGLPWP